MEEGAPLWVQRKLNRALADIGQLPLGRYLQANKHEEHYAIDQRLRAICSSAACASQPDSEKSGKHSDRRALVRRAE